jgi:hypothetical protein
MDELDVISRNVFEGTEEYRDGRDVHQLSPRNQERWSPKGDAASSSSLKTGLQFPPVRELLFK